MTETQQTTRDRLTEAVRQYRQAELAVYDLRAELAEAESVLGSLMVERDEAIRVAMTDPALPVGAVQDIAGLSRARLYQIRDGRR